MKGAIGMRKGAWTEEEDVLLKKCVERYGEGNWHQIPRRAGLNRCRKSSRLRWLNYLKPNIKRGAFQEDEVDMIIRLHKLLGNRWSLIARRLPGRTSNYVKNYWNTHLAKKVIHHKPNRDNPPGKFAAKVNVIRPRPWTFSKSSALFNGNAMLVAPSTPLGGNHGQPYPVLSHQDKESAWWENLFTDSSSHEGQPDASLWPRELAMEEGQNGRKEHTFDSDIWELLGANPQVVHHKPDGDDLLGKFAAKVNIIRPRPWTFSKSLALFNGNATLVAPSTPLGGNHGQPYPVLSHQDKESAWWENLFTDSSSDEGQPDASLWPRELAMEEGQNGRKGHSFDTDIWELLGANPQVVHHKPDGEDPPGKFTAKVNVIRPQPWTFSKSSALFNGNATLVTPSTPLGGNHGQPCPVLSHQDKESAWWENLFIDSSSDEGQPDASLWPRELAMEEGRNGRNEYSLDTDIGELLGANPQAMI